MAKILVTHPGHFVRSPGGEVCTRDRVSTYAFWSRYLSAFDGVVVAARTQSVETVDESLPRADGPDVAFFDLPDFVGPWGYLRHRRVLQSRIRQAVERCDAYCLRVPCPLATLACREIRRRGRPFGVEIFADPWGSLAPGSVDTIARPVARYLQARRLRLECQLAHATAYVTQDRLQRLYPSNPARLTTHYSSVELSEEAYVAQPRTCFRDAHRLVFVGTLAVLYKGPDLLLRALARCGQVSLRLSIVGDGQRRRELEQLAKDLNVFERVVFLGTLSSPEAVRRVLDESDLFVLPSRTEGLPRAMIEAMARGLPCIGSTAGGIPELLPPDDLVPPGDVEALSLKISEVLSDPPRMQAAARRNWEAAKQYASPILAARRRAFYQHLRQLSET